jgi:hypothetical protein
MASPTHVWVSAQGAKMAATGCIDIGETSTAHEGAGISLVALLTIAAGGLAAAQMDR